MHLAHTFETRKKELDMNKNFVRPLILTAAALALGVAANAQGPMVANVPFSFTVNGKTLPAGSYTVGRLGLANASVIMVQERHTGKSAFTIVSDATDERHGTPRLVFRCYGGSGCQLAEAWKDYGQGWQIPTPRVKPAEKELIAVIPLHHATE
jgi:hypothetical protein